MHQRNDDPKTRAFYAYEEISFKLLLIFKKQSTIDYNNAEIVNYTVMLEKKYQLHEPPATVVKFG
ncbi:MAG: hypothetical protein OXI74_16545 [Rhodospirillaceae bacterium]|nr:hypothetical protein [Rhodospirillaceae bacterium]